MKTPANIPCASLARFGGFCAAFALSAASLSAQTLFLDFGPTATTTTSNSPYHVDTPTAGTSWNQIQTADVNSGLLFADGSAATGVTVNIGAGSYTSVNFATTPTGSSALGTGVNTGVFLGTSVAKDAIFHSVGGTPQGPSTVAAQISGLAAGNYDIYIAALNSNSNPDNSAPGFNFFDLSQRVGAVASSPVTDTFAPGATTTISNYGGFQNRAGLVTTWIDGVNYAKLSVSITAGQNLIVYTMGVPTAVGATRGDSVLDPAEEQRGFLNMIQITPAAAIPEPSAAAALAGFMALGAVALRRRRAAR